jgi:large subunit ribosomal protein L1
MFSGSLSLPYGTAKTIRTIVFTNDAYIQQADLKAGGDALVDQVLQGEVSVESFDRAVASSDIMPTLSKKVARHLGPRGLMPSANVGTLDTQLTGKDLQFQTEKAEKEGIVRMPVGKSSLLSEDKLLDK